MKTVSAALKAHFGQATTTLAMLWKITRADGTILGFTSFDQNITYNSTTYLASSGFLPSANQSGSDLSVDNLEVTGFLDNSVIREVDIRNALYDYASVEQRCVNWADLTQGDVLLREAIIGNITMKNGLFVAELRGLTNYLSTIVGSSYSTICRAQLYSTPLNGIDPGSHYFCYVKLSDYEQTGSVASAADAVHMTPNSGLTQKGSATNPTNPAPADWFDEGILTFTSGVNNGFSYEIKHWDGTTFTFQYPMASQPAANDTFKVSPGCDKTATPNGCLKFQGYDTGQNIVAVTNILNHRGEPFIPGMDQILDYPSPK